MYWERQVLFDNQSMTFAKTWEEDLPKDGLLGSIAIYVSSTQNGNPFATAVKWRLLDYISKIEVIANANHPIKSYDGRTALGCAFYDDGVIPTSMWRSYSNTPHRQWIPVNFGRFLKDTQYGLDLSRFNNVKLRITNDATATEFTTDITVRVIGYFLREAPAGFSGMFEEMAWETWAPAAAASHSVDLPTDRRIRRILLRARPGVDTADARNNSSMGRLMNPLKFTKKTGGITIFEGTLEDLGHCSILEGGRYADTMVYLDRTAGYGFEVGIGYVLHGLGAVGAEGAADITYGYTMKQGDIQDSSQVMTQREADNPLEAHFRGWGFMHLVPLLEAKAPDLSDMLDPDLDKQVRITATCQSGTTVSGTHAAAESAVILSSLVQ